MFVFFLCLRVYFLNLSVSWVHRSRRRILAVPHVYELACDVAEQEVGVFDAMDFPRRPRDSRRADSVKANMEKEDGALDSAPHVDELLILVLKNETSK